MPEKTIVAAAVPIGVVENDDIEVGQPTSRLLLPSAQNSHDNRISSTSRPLPEEDTHMPLFTFLLVLINTSVFCYGLYFMIGTSDAEVTAFTPISPPSEKLVFATVSTWPDCADNRKDVWRIFSHQIVHAGYAHLLSNQIMLLLYGILFERVQGCVRLGLVYELGVVGGAMCHSLVWPYRPLIGCSHGIYSLYGACVAHLMVNFSTTHGMIKACMGVAVLMQITTDVLSFLVFFNEDVGYSAHVGGFFTGLLVGLAIAKIEKKMCWKWVLSLLAFAAAVVILAMAIHRYEAVWPPRTIVRPFWSPIDDLPCCAEYFELRSADNVDEDDDISESYYCSGLNLVPYNN